jgi:hypothetical protein
MRIGESTVFVVGVEGVVERDSTCDAEPIDPFEDAREDLERLLDLIERNHYSMHTGAYRHCMNSFCRGVADAVVTQ